MILQQEEFFHVLSPHIPKKVRSLFQFGYETLVAQEIISTRTNARQSSHNRHTAKSKMFRLLKNQTVSSALACLVGQLNLVTEDDIVAVDFSDFGDKRQVLMFAKQTKQGRAIPVYFEILEYPIEKDSQNLFIIAAIERFYAATNCTPVLVFDRGFACPSIIEYMARNGHIFIILIKKRKRLSTSTTGRTVAAEDHVKNDLSVISYGHVLRLVRSDQPLNDNDPWYLITNDTDSTRDEIISRYYHRFEIEEFFRDAKRLLRLEWVRCKTTHSLSVLLWFACITAWLFAQLAISLTDEQERERQQWRLSQFRYVLELLQRELRIASRIGLVELARVG